MIPFVKRGTSIETRKQINGFKGLIEEDLGVSVNGRRHFFFRGDENALKLMVVMILEICEYSKIQQIEELKANELKSLLMKMKEESEKAGLKLSIQTTKIMASSPITMADRWGNNGNSERLNFLGFKITADGDCSLEIKRHLLLGRKTVTNLDSILKSRYITLPPKVHIVKAMVFPVVM